MLQIFDHLPRGLLEHEAHELADLLGRPTLIHLPGVRPEPLFCSVLLHGNEISGWEALRTVLGRHRKRLLPRALSLFIGNVNAARYGCRRLDDQPDFNRVWRGGKLPEHAMAVRVIDAMRARGPFASIDIHNNSGSNPHYACVNTLDPEALELATMFNRQVVYFTEPNTVLALAFSSFSPSITIECGLPGDADGIAQAVRLIETCLALDTFPDRVVPSTDIDVYHTAVRVRVHDEIRIGDDGEALDLRLQDNLDNLNFKTLPAGTILARVITDQPRYLDVRDSEGNDRGADYIALRDGCLVTARAVIPSMLTRDARIIRQDCLCYFMEPYDAPLPPTHA